MPPLLFLYSCGSVRISTVFATVFCIKRDLYHVKFAKHKIYAEYDEVVFDICAYFYCVIDQPIKIENHLKLTPVLRGMYATAAVQMDSATTNIVTQ